MLNKKQKAFAVAKLQIETDTVNKKAVAASIKEQALATTQKDLLQFSSENKQEDLLYFKAVYATVGFNLNDDVFVPNEFWSARKTPILKPINWQHEDKDIIGVIYAVEAQDLSGASLDIESEEIQNDNFELIVHGVIYKYTFAKLAEEIENRSKNGEFFVSMEAWFSEFDYAVLEDADTMKVVARTENTETLDSYLRCFGGSGKWDNKRIGRVLKDVTFGGLGVVDNPANPRSAGIVHASEEKMELTMADKVEIKEVVKAELEERAKAEKVVALEQELTTVKAEQAKAAENLQRAEQKAEREAEAKRLADAVIAKFGEELDLTVATVSDKPEIKDLDKAVSLEDKFKVKLAWLVAALKEAGKAGELEVVQKELAEAKAKLAEFEAAKAAAEKEAKTNARKEELKTVVADEEIVEKLMASFAALDDAAYASRLEELKLVIASKVPLRHDGGQGAPAAEGASGESKAGTTRDRKINVAASLENAKVEKVAAPEGNSNVTIESPFKGLSGLVVSTKKDK